MKKVLLSICIIFTTTTSFAQEKTFSMGLKGGLNHSWLSDDREGDVHRNSFHAGVFAHLRLNDHWRLQPEAYFSAQGEEGNKLYNQVTQIYNYLVVPIMVQYRFKKRFFVEAGPQIGVLLNEKKPGARKEYNILFRENNGMNTFDVIIAAGAGYQICQHVAVYARVNQGITNIRTYKWDDKDYSKVLQLGVNYRLF